jgi:hypothetical protein
VILPFGSIYQSVLAKKKSDISATIVLVGAALAISILVAVKKIPTSKVDCSRVVNINIVRKAMSEEFPVDRWLRKHMRPGNTLLTFFGFLGSCILLHHFVSVQTYMTIMMVLIYLVMAWVVGLMTWMIVWRIKHPTKYEACKECGRIKPPKYED